MKFCVVAKISKRSVSFWYQSDSNAYAPLRIKDSNEIPLYFYVNGNDFIFGSAARDLFKRNAPDAYGNYFEIIKDPGKHFSIYGNKKPVKQLLYYGIEQYLSHFLNTVLYKTDSIESYRQHFPLRFLFDTDIEDNEKSLVEQLFQEAGYFNLDRVHFNRLLFEVLAQKEILPIGKAVLLLSGIDDVLYLKLYKDINAEAIGSLKLEGHGADPRVKILADMIVEYIIIQKSYLSIDKDLEIAFLLPFCVGLLENLSPIIKGDAELSDGNKYWFKVNERNLNDRLQYYSNDSMIYTVIDDLLKTNGLMIQEVVILLGTEEISTSYFSGKLLKKYQYVKEVTTADRKDTMKAVFAEISDSAYRGRPVLSGGKPSASMTPPAQKTKLSAPSLPPLPGSPGAGGSKPPAPGMTSPPASAELPVLSKPSLPPLKPSAPPLPPKKAGNVSQPPVSVPRLPEVTPVSKVKVSPVKLPPLPPKKG